MTSAKSPVETFFIPNEFYGKYSNVRSARLARLQNKNLCFAHFSASKSLESFRKTKLEIRRREFNAKNTPEWWRTAITNQVYFELNTDQLAELGMTKEFQ
jgi:hypothetical protein